MIFFTQPFYIIFEGRNDSQFTGRQTILLRVCLLVFLAELRRVLSRRFLCFLSRLLFHQESFSFSHTASLSTLSKAPPLLLSLISNRTFIYKRIINGRQKEKQCLTQLARI